MYLSSLNIFLESNIFELSDFILISFKFILSKFSFSLYIPLKSLPSSSSKKELITPITES